MQILAEWQGDYQVKITARSHSLMVDEPQDCGGDDTGPMPTEMLLSAVASCLCLTIYHLSKKLKIVLPDLQLNVSGVMDYSGHRCRSINIQVVSSLEPTALNRLLKKAGQYCYVSNTLSQGCEINIQTSEIKLKGEEW